MKTIKFLFLVLGIVLPIISFAQTSLLQDKSGETSIIINNHNLVLLNVGDGSFSANLSFNKPTWFIGTNLKLKSTEGASSLLDGYKFKPKFDFDVFGGNTIPTSNISVTQYIYYGLKFNVTHFNLLKKDNTNTFDEKEFYGGSVNFGYNRIDSINIFRNEGLASSYLFGISANYSQINNLEDLKSVETYSLLTKDTSNTKTVLMSDKKSGYNGDYTNFGSLRINLDTYIFPQSIGGRIGFGGYLRSQITGTSPRTNAGAGFIVGQSGAPTNIVFGLLYQFNDLFNQQKAENDLIKRGGINIVAGYNF